MKKCPFCAEQIQDEAIKCRHCGEDLSGNRKRQTVVSGNKSAGCGTMLFIIVVASIIIFNIGFRQSVEMTKNTPYEPSKIDVCVTANQAVRIALKSPSSAQFPSCSEVNIENLGGKTFRVSGHVDAQNSFGAMLRSEYVVKLQNTGGSADWKILDLQMN